MDFLFGEEHYGLPVVLAFFLALALIGFFGWLVHRFRSARAGAASTRGHQPRLAVIDAAKVDGRRHLILIRRDNVEHLLMIGGPTDAVVESNIVRAAAREPALVRPPAFAEATQRPAATQNEQRESAPTAPTPPRPQRQSPMAEEPVPQHTEAERRVPLAPRQTRPFDQQLSDQPARKTASHAAREREVSRDPQLPTAVLPQNTPAEAVFTPAAEHNFAETAQWLVEAALHRHRTPRSDAELKARPRSGLDTSSESQSESPPEADAERETVLSAPAVGEAGLARGEPKLGREGKTASPRPSYVYDSLERNMANLLSGGADENDYPIRYTRRAR